MQLRDLGQVTAHLEGSAVFEDKLWDGEVDKTTRMDLVMFHARMTSHGLGKQALEALDVLQGEAIAAVAMGRVKQVGFLGYDSTRRTFTTDDLIVGLNTLPVVARQAVLYALEARVAPQKAEHLSWRDVLAASDQTPLMVEILRQRNRVRHIRLPHVFWRNMQPNLDAPLMELQDMAERAFERRWDMLQADYESILQISARAEADSFLAMTRSLP